MKVLFSLMYAFCSLCLPSWLQAQDLLSGPDVDSAYVDMSDYDWSARLMATYKYQNVTIRDHNNKVRYTPVDPLSAGVGFSYKPWVFDIGFRLNTNSAHQTQRIDLATSALIGPHLVDLGFLYYKGFEEQTGNFLNPFRDDIRTLTMSLDYIYFPNFKKASYAGSRTGLGFQKKKIGSPLVGGFAERHFVKGDSTLVPESQEFDYSESLVFREFELRSAGIQFGYGQFLPFSNSFYGAAILTSGIGAYWGSKEYDSGEDLHDAGAILQLNLYAAIGYNWNRIYSVLNYGLDSRFISFGDKRNYNYALGRLKLAFGYKFLK